MKIFRRSLTEIEALDRELERLHELIGHSNAKFNGDVYQRIKELENLLIDIAKKKNGLEF